MIFRHLLNMRSHPTWVRGLKHHHWRIIRNCSQSHPTWVRGLKLPTQYAAGIYVGRTLRGCVD